MSVWTDIEGWIEPEISAAEQAGEEAKADIVAWVGTETALVDTAWKSFWANQKAIFSKFSLSQVGIIQGLIKTGAADAAAGDYSAITASVLTQAAGAELTWLTSLGQAEVASVVAVLTPPPS